MIVGANPISKSNHVGDADRLTQNQNNAMSDDPAMAAASHSRPPPKAEALPEPSPTSKAPTAWPNSAQGSKQD